MYINLPRRAGKTTYLLKLLMSNDKYILVVPTEYIKRELMKTVNDNAKNRILTINDIVYNPVPKDKLILIDELQMCLELLIGNSIVLALGTATISDEFKRIKEEKNDKISM